MNLLTIGSIALGLAIGLMTILFIFRIVLTWYPQLDTNRFPLNLVVIPTEPILKLLRKVIPPLGGVDITPIVCVGICTLLREILLGQQGLITMAMNSFH
jgi:YggT family protein